MSRHRVCNCTMGVTSGEGTAYPSGAPEFTPSFSGICFTRSYVLCVCFVDHYLSFCPLSFGHCVVCPASIYRFFLPLWYLQTLLRIRFLSWQVFFVFFWFSLDGIWTHTIDTLQQQTHNLMSSVLCHLATSAMQNIIAAVFEVLPCIVMRI